jgi:hypothetical protein
MVVCTHLSRLETSRPCDFQRQKHDRLARRQPRTQRRNGEPRFRLELTSELGGVIASRSFSSSAGVRSPPAVTTVGAVPDDWTGVAYIAALPTSPGRAE